MSVTSAPEGRKHVRGRRGTPGQVLLRVQGEPVLPGCFEQTLARLEVSVRATVMLRDDSYVRMRSR